MSMERQQEGKASRNKRLKREALLTSAYALFTDKGFAETTIADITEAAGVAKGTYYLYYKDKEDIRDHLIRIKAEEALHKAYEAMLLEHGGEPLTDMEEVIVYFVGNILTQLEEDPVLLTFISRNLAWGLIRPNVRDIEPFGPMPDNRLIDVIIRLFRDSPVQYRDPEILLYLVVEFVGASCYSSITGSEPLPIEELRPYLLDAVRGIIRSQKA